MLCTVLRFRSTFFIGFYSAMSFFGELIVGEHTCVSKLFNRFVFDDILCVKNVKVFRVESLSISI